MSKVISIGRNVKGIPMTWKDWDMFKNELMLLIEKHEENEIHFVGEGTGIYEGQTEQSFTVIFSGQIDGLPLLATRFDQDAIALTVGITKFIQGGN